MNRELHLVARPVGFPKESDFRVVETPAPQAVQEGDVILKLIYCSVDPYMRGRMNDAKSYTQPWQLNQPINGFSIAQVVDVKPLSAQTIESLGMDSQSFLLNVGDVVTGALPYQELVQMNMIEVWEQQKQPGIHQIRKINDLRDAEAKCAETGAKPTLRLTHALSLLGMPGMSAYFGLLRIGQPKENDIVLVSAAAGAVGSMVGQIAKIKGCRVIGICGSDEKSHYLKESLHFDEVINYKTVTNIREAVSHACPKGLDIYFDNVGGEMLDAALLNLNRGARIVLCGAISGYNLERPDVGPRLTFRLVQTCSRMEGFLVFQFAQDQEEALQAMKEWITRGLLSINETIYTGFENIPAAFIAMLQGQNVGKMIVKIGDLQ